MCVCVCERERERVRERKRLRGGLEHLKIETRLIVERFASVMGECVIYEL